MSTISLSNLKSISSLSFNSIYRVAPAECHWTTHDSGSSLSQYKCVDARITQVQGNSYVTNEAAMINARCKELYQLSKVSKSVGNSHDQVQLLSFPTVRKNFLLIWFASMSTSNSSIVVRTGTSAVVRAYPWTNGAVFEENRRLFMEQHLQGKQYDDAFVAMVLVSNGSALSFRVQRIIPASEISVPSGHPGGVQSQ